jgi:hypothetical protein
MKAELAAEDLACRYWAGWSGALLGEPAAIPVLQRLAESGHTKREQACAMALRRMSIDQAQAWLKSLASSPKALRLAVQAAGVIGDPANIPWLIQQMAIRIWLGWRANRSPTLPESTSPMTIWTPTSRRVSKPGQRRIPKTRTWTWIRTKTCLGPIRS